MLARPTDTPVYASSYISQWRLQDSRPGWIRCSFPVGLFHPYNMPVYPALSGWPSIHGLGLVPDHEAFPSQS